MTLDEARGLIGQQVVYRAPHIGQTEAGEQGVVTSVNDTYVFVRYGTHLTAQATPPERLTR